MKYCELHAHSCFSLLDGVPQPGDLVERAIALGISGIALTDHDNLYGIVPFIDAAEEHGVHGIIGSEITMEDGSHLTLLAENDAGYSSLCRLISIGQARKPKGESALDWASLAEHAEGLICLTGYRKGLVAQQVLDRNLRGARETLNRLVSIFGCSNVFVELQRHHRQGDVRLTKRLAALADECGLGYVATGNVHYITRDDADLRSVVKSVKSRIPIADNPSLKRTNYEQYLRSPTEMTELFADLPDAITRTVEIAERCHATLPRGLQLLPEVPVPDGMTAGQYLRQLCYEQLPHHYPDHLGEATERLEKELAIIAELRLENYFLLIWDVVQFCKRENILFHGRGSAANSIVSKLLGFTVVDPLESGMVVERFISVERGGTPDFDFDIEHIARERVIQYFLNKYHSAMACTYSTYRDRSATRDAAFALSVPPDTLAEMIDAKEDGKHIPKCWAQTLSMKNRMRRKPRHLSQHNGGVIATRDPISWLLPIEPAAMKDRFVTQFDKEFLETLGIVKIDLLGLRMLTAISDALKAIYKRYGIKIDLHQLKFTDKAVYDLICSCKTIGIFQVESGAQVSVIPQLQPRDIYDLEKQVSLIRPGPLQGKMVRPFLLRRLGLEPVTYLHPLLENALHNTLGVLIFQEQVLQIAHDVGGFSLGRGELLRKTLGSKYATEDIEAFHEEFVTGAATKGVEQPIAEQIWQMMSHFAGYSFSRAHAAAFARIVYWSAWLRLHYPTEYWCGLLRNAPLGTYPARVLAAEAQRTGTKFLPFDINRSMAKPRVEDGRIRHGLGYIEGIGEVQSKTIIEARARTPFNSLTDLIARTKLPRRSLESLILAGALDQFGERRQLLWDLAEAMNIAYRPDRLPLEYPDEQISLTPLTADEKMMATFARTGITIDRHITDFRRNAFDRAKCLRLGQLRAKAKGSQVRIGGISADGVRTPPTANGTGFLRLENTQGIVDVIIPRRLLETKGCRKALQSGFLVINGTMREKGTVVSVVAESIYPLEG